MRRFPSRFRVSTALLLVAALAALAPAVSAQNIAQGKSALQSSTYPNGNAGKAVDGNTNGNFFANSVTATQDDFNAWWYVDLAGTYAINSITLWNRTDCCPDRLSNFFVSVLADGTPNVGAFGAPTVWRQLFPGAAGTTTVFSPGGAAGRYVKVQYNNRADFLSLAEVQVTGSDVTAVPEPASLVLVASGLVAVGMAARRKKTT